MRRESSRIDASRKRMCDESVIVVTCIPVVGLNSVFVTIFLCAPLVRIGRNRLLLSRVALNLSRMCSAQACPARSPMTCRWSESEQTTRVEEWW